MSTSLLSGVLVEHTDCFSALSFHLTFQRCLNTGGGTLKVILSKVVYDVSQFKCPECRHKPFVSLMSHEKKNSQVVQTVGAQFQ